MPAGSSSIQVSRGLPVLEVCVVSEDSEGMFGPPQVMPPVGKCFHHGKQLSFIDVIVTLCRGEGGRVVSDGVELRFSLLVRGHIFFALLLGEYRSDPICGGIGL